ncbi:major facilitator superfamily MFS_1 [Exiguobacterium sp. AT1b]|uniref:Major facilitator superfamily MFS_1 n=1 Tax=Exiguobacterium sp. (strain ATCC BAA-1283 / AT1b) TaxID=360911 RepID=C4L2U3_EXISA|nr:MFS transporter [Exiguobacterium sp. AT1b]ACQ69351.1 major facilitator superfamily MFS_1 [Exiguobacterium sp. AT1b]
MKSFYTLLVSQWLANTGDVLYIVALIALLYQQTRSALMAASFPIAVTAGMTLSGFFFARILSRYSLGKTLVLSQLMKTVTLVLVLFTDSILVLGLVLFIAFLDGFARPIQASFIPRLTTNRQQANSLVQGSNQFIQLAMWPLGTMLVSLTSSAIALIVSLVLFSLSTIVTIYFYQSLTEDIVDDETDESITLRDSLTYVRTSPFARRVTGFVTYESFVSTLWISALLLVYLERHLQVDPGWWGTLNASFLISMIAASAYLYRSRRAPSLPSTAVLSIVSALLFGVTEHLAFAILALVIQGAATQIRIIQTNTVIQEQIPTTQLPYVYSVQQTGYALAFSMGSLLFGLLADGLPIDSVYLLGAFLTIPLIWIGRLTEQSILTASSV